VFRQIPEAPRQPLDGIDNVQPVLQQEVFSLTATDAGDMVVVLAPETQRIVFGACLMQLLHQSLGF
jgi:hypothetical protein